MVNYTTSLIWLASYIGYKFTAFNMAHFSRVETLFEKGDDHTNV